MLRPMPPRIQAVNRITAASSSRDRLTPGVERKAGRLRTIRFNSPTPTAISAMNIHNAGWPGRKKSVMNDDQLKISTM